MDTKQIVPITPNKSLLATFVQDAVEFETSKHTLIAAIKKCRSDRGSIEYNNDCLTKNALHKSNAKLTEARNKLQRAMDAQKDISSKYQPLLEELSENVRALSSYTHRDFRNAYPDKCFGVSGTIFILLLCISIGIVLLCVMPVGLLLAPLGDTSLTNSIAVSFGTIGAIFGFIFGLLWINTSERNSHQEMLSNAKEKHKKTEAEFAERQQRIEAEIVALASNVAPLYNAHQALLAQIEKDNARTKQQTGLMDQQLAVMQNDLNVLENQLQQFYSVNLIPPDYRSLDCALALHQIFRNDLADTMREAILLYDERVFRGEMIKGLENIYYAINELGGLMSETVHQLTILNHNAQSIADNIRDVSAQLANNSNELANINRTIIDSADNLSNQFEYSRYADHSIRANTDRLIWYEEQRRQGLL